MSKNEELKELILQYMSDPNNRMDQIMNFVRMQHPVLFEYVLEYTKQLPEKYKFSHRLYWTMNSITEFPTCPNCGKPNTRVIKVSDGYDGPKKYCSQSCITKSAEYQQKYAETNMERYGAANVFASESIKEKIKQTCLEKYGTENPAKTEAVKQKMYQTNIERFGTKSALQSDVIKEKMRQTNLERHGVEWTFQSEAVKEKIKQSVQQRFGVDNVSQSEEIKEKRTKSFVEHFGVDNPLKNADVKEKMEQTNLERYGSRSYLGTEECIQNNKIACRKQLYERLKDNKYVELVTTFDEFTNLNTTIFKWKCKRCGEIFESETTKNYVVVSQFYARCPKCFPMREFRSHHEQDVANYIIDTFPQLQVKTSVHDVLGDRHELDIYIPEKQIAVEYDGLYWHSIRIKGDKNYHLNKTNICESKGIQLIHIFEDEWIFHEDVVKSRLNILLGKCDRKIYARQCVIKELDYSTCESFLNLNHMQGNCQSRYRYGLYYKDELVSVMTFGYMRKALGSTNASTTEYELLRFCNLLNTVVVGGSSKLFKHFIKTMQPTKITSYCDRRWSIGKLYSKLGFVKTNVSQPNYWYVVNGSHREHRFNWRKDVLKNKLKTFDPSLTEYENMLYNGYDCIYDCGNLVFEWTK